MKRILLLFSFGLLTIFAQSAARSAAVAKPINFEIEAQPLTNALARWCHDTHLSLGFDADVDIEKVTSRKLNGAYLPATALRKLLAPAGFYAEPVSETLFRVKVRKPVQTVQNKQPESPGGGSEAAGIGEVLVTGTQIHDARPDYYPLSSYARPDIERSGAFTTDELSEMFISNFRRINPQTTVGIGSSFLAANNLPHGSAFDSFGMDPGATLVLMDGHRMPLSGHDGSYADISMIPLSAVDHVDLVTDAASAIYGGDALAGVVNFVLRRGFRGFETTPYYGFTTGGGGRQLGFSQLAGNVWSNGDVFFTYENYHEQAIEASERDHLVPGPWPYQLVPQQARQSALLTAHQEVTQQIAISAESYYSSRDFSQEYTAFPFIGTLSEGNTRTFGGTATTILKLPGNWLSSLDAGFYGEKERGATTALGAQQRFDTHSNTYTTELRADGPLFPLPGGPVKLSTGFSWRLETFNDREEPLGPSGSGLGRNVWGVNSEILAPIIGKGNQVAGISRFELSIALRWDEYENRDSGLLNAHAVNPKLGALWSPGADVAFRGAYTPSAFRAAPLSQLGSQNPALLTQVANPDPQGAPIDTLYLTGGNTGLHPERTDSFTIGIDWKPDPPSGWSFSASYFHIHDRDRIATPLMGSLSVATPAEIQALIERLGVLDPLNLGTAGVHTVSDGRYQNMGSLHAAGFETTGTGKAPVPIGEMNFRMDAQYLMQLANQATPTAAYVPVVGTVFNPPTLRLRSEAWWSAYNWTVGVAADYTSPFKDTAGGNEHIPSWLVFNTRVAREFSKTTISINVNNITNRDPPPIASVTGRPLNYDASNAYPTGCEILIEVTQRW